MVFSEIRFLLFSHASIGSPDLVFALESRPKIMLETKSNEILVAAKIETRAPDLSIDVTSLIGQHIRTENGKEGKLICASGMGLTPIDVFNEIMTKPHDLRNFLGEENWKESETHALRKVFQIVFFRKLSI